MIPVLTIKEYNKVSKSKLLREIHLAAPLFPNGKITQSNLTKFLIKEYKTRKQHNIIFHISIRHKNVPSLLEKSKITVSDKHDKWYILFYKTDRAAAEARARKIVPYGLVKSSEIDAALKLLSSPKIIY